MADIKQARVLRDVLPHGLKAGQIVEGTAALIKELEADGAVDSKRAAVEYARSEGAKVVSAGPLPHELVQAEVAALQVQLEAAAEDAEKAAIAEQLAAKRAELAALL